MLTVVHFLRLRSFWVPLFALLFLLAESRADAALLEYRFTGIAGPGSAMVNIDGSGFVDLSGAAFTVTGHTINDVDLYLGGAVDDGIGLFAATSAYEFGSLGSFTSEPGADFYAQFCYDGVGFQCVGISDPTGQNGWAVAFTQAVAGNPDFGVSIGTQVVLAFDFGRHILINQDGNGLELNGLGGSPAEITSVSATAIAEPAPLVLFVLGFGVLLARRRAAF